jgi:cold shock CspA family protein
MTEKKVRVTGTVDGFDVKKNWGFCVTDGGKKAFLHGENHDLGEDGIPAKDDRISYVIEIEKRGRVAKSWRLESKVLAKPRAHVHYSPPKEPKPNPRAHQPNFRRM